METIVPFQPKGLPPAEHMLQVLKEVRDQAQADYLQFIFEPGKNGKYKSSFSSQARTMLSEESTYQYKEFAENFVRESTTLILNKAQLNQLAIGFLDPESVPFQHFVFLPVSLPGYPIGMILLGYEGTFNIEQHKFEQISKGWINHIASLVGYQAKNEKEFLFNLSHKLIVIRDRKKLFDNLRFQIHDYMGLYASTIHLVDDYLQLENHCFFNGTIEQRDEEAIFRQLQGDEINQLLDNFKKVIRSGENIQMVLGSASGGEGTVDGFQILKGRGIREINIVCLAQGTVVYGVWIMLSKFRTNLRQQTSFLPSVINYLIGSVNNIRANEKILSLNQESDILQALNIDFASTRNKKDLLRIIRFRLTKLFDLSHHFVATINEDDLTLSVFLTDIPEKQKYSVDDARLESIRYPINDGILDKVLLSQDPVFFDLDQLTTRSRLPGYFSGANGASVNKAVMVPLQINGKIFGIWAICQKRHQEISSKQLSLINRISNQFSIAMANIQAIEIIKNREIRQAILMQLSIDITTLKTRENLYAVINKCLQQLIPYQGIEIAIFDEEYKLHCLLPSDDNDQQNSEITKRKASIAVPEEYAKKILEINDIFVIDLSELSVRAKEQDQIRVDYEQGIRRKAGIALWENNRKLGAFYVNSGAVNFTDQQLELIKGISYQVSTAVSNIIAQEQGESRKNENAVLLSISNDIVVLRDKEDFLSLITKKVKKIIGFTHSVISIIDQDARVLKAFMLDKHSKNKNHRDYQQMIAEVHYMDDPLVQELISAEHPVRLDLKEWMAKDETPLFIKVSYESGFRENTSLRFLNEHGAFGLWMIFFDQKEIFANRQYPFLQTVAGQISRAVENIQANEHIASREREKAILLSISNELTAVRSFGELVPVVNKKLQALFGFSHSHICTLDKQHPTYSTFIFDDQNNEQPAYLQKEMPKVSIDPGFLQQLSDPELPGIIILDKFDREYYQEVYERLQLPYEIKEALVIRLLYSGQVLGWWTIFYENQQTMHNCQFSLMQNIANQLSVAVANIVANNTIERREEEKSRLLAFSNSIATVKDKIELSHIFSQHIKELCSVSDYCLHWVNDDKVTHSPYLWDSNITTNYPLDIERLIKARYAVKDGVFDLSSSTSEILVFDLEEEMKRPDCPDYIKIVYSNHARRILAFAVHIGQEVTGIFLSNYNEILLAEQHVVKSLCAQLAVAVSNLIATEKVQQQLVEINRYKEQLEEEKYYLKEELETTNNYAEIIGQSPELTKVFHMVSQVAAVDSTVLILGETGTGKELIARAIHNDSKRKDQLMVKVNCAALPFHLIESELFGHERGSFTGATERRIGKFELAHGGTLFLDEIGEMPLELQAKLLRAVQEREVERVGGKAVIKVDVRLIVATNRDLEVEVAEGRFRSDLYYRLNIFPIYLPPLRERKEDIPMLTAHFINKFAKKLNKPKINLSVQAMNDLVSYSWPGNVRELEHLIERSLLINSGPLIKEIRFASSKLTVAKGMLENTSSKTIDENERDHIIKILKRCKGKVGGENGAAIILGVPPTTLNSKMKRLGIKRGFNI